MQKCGFKLVKNTYYYHGGGIDCLNYAKRRLAKLEENSKYIERRFLEEKRRYETHLKSIEKCKGFIFTIERKIEEEKQKED